MNKKLLGTLIVTTLIITAFSFSTATASGKPTWESPWKETDKNIYNLLEKGFQFSNATFTTLSGLGTTGGVLEVTYL